MAVRLRSLAAPVLFAVLSPVLFAFVFNVGRGGDPDVGYFVFSAFLSLPLALALCVLASPLPAKWRVPTVLSGWTGLQVAILLGPIPGTIAACLALAALSMPTPLATSAWRLGLAVGLSSSVGFFVSERIVEKLGVAAFQGEASVPIAQSLAILVSIAGYAACERLATVSRPMGLLPSLALASLAATVAIPFVLGAPAPTRTIPSPSVADAVASPRSDVILLVLDTVRADHMSVYGYHRKTTPQLEAFLERREQAVAYPWAFANGTWTLPSHASLFTGELASRHGVQAESALSATGIRSVELDAVETLAEVLFDDGYRTAGIFANGWLEMASGLERGFEVFFRPLGVTTRPPVTEAIRRRWLPGWHAKAGEGLATAATINDAVVEALESCGAAPCFVFGNYLEAHAPYVPEREFFGTFASPEVAPGPAQPEHEASELALVEARYDEEIRELDAALGSLIADLERSGRLDRSWLVITSDHGEAFGEHGLVEHGSTVYGEVTRIPLIVSPPLGHRIRATSEPVGLIDVGATIAAIGTGRTIGSGRDLRSPDPIKAVVQIEMFPNALKVARHGLDHGRPARATVDGSLKLVDHAGTPVELFDLEVDALERHDIAASHAELAAALESSLPDLATHEKENAAMTLTAAQREQLRVLGYLD
ncbi:MAG: sulfatase [bacterium]|nr:sulfatase [bacterium]